MNDLLAKIAKGLKTALFPLDYTCSVCGAEVFDSRPFCQACFEKTELISGYKCDKCGRATLSPKGECDSCRGKHEVDKSRSVFVYGGSIASAIRKLKYSSAKYLAEVLAPYLKTACIAEFFAPDVIGFIPMTERAEYERGYNQSRLLAEELGKLLDCSVEELLVKTKETENQASLGYEERMKNLKGSFKATEKKPIKDKRVLLVDDVLTTGATSDEAASVLKKAGAKSVYLLTLASVSKEKPSTEADFSAKTDKNE